MHENNPYIALLLARQFFANVERNAQRADTVREVRRAGRAARWRRLGAHLVRIGTVRVGPVGHRLGGPAVPPQ